jgi:hypothetical protein
MGITPSQRRNILASGVRAGHKAKKSARYPNAIAT